MFAKFCIADQKDGIMGHVESGDMAEHLQIEEGAFNCLFYTLFVLLKLGTAGNLEGDGYHLGGVFVLGPGEEVGFALVCT